VVKDIRLSLLAIRQSPIAAVSRLADLSISRFADKIWLGRNFALPLSALQKSHPQSPIAIRVHYSPFAAVSTAGGQSRLPFATRCSPLTIRYSPFATRHSPFQKFSPVG
jgi:hypothetical protein